MKKRKLPIANIITGFRIIGSLILIFCKYNTSVFFVIYTLCGISDVLDGYLARKLDQVSDFGSKLDSIADLLFYTIMMIRVMPVLSQSLTKFVWAMIYGILILRLGLYILVAVKKKRFNSEHTLLNKFTGALVFGVGLLAETKIINIYGIVCCLVALTAWADELIKQIKS